LLNLDQALDQSDANRSLLELLDSTDDDGSVQDGPSEHDREQPASQEDQRPSL
jgi:hypothetical protein